MSKIFLPTINLDREKLTKLYRDVNGNREMFDWALEIEIIKNIDFDEIYSIAENYAEFINIIENEINLKSLVKFCRTGKFIDE